MGVIDGRYQLRRKVSKTRDFVHYRAFDEETNKPTSLLILRRDGLLTDVTIDRMRELAEGLDAVDAILPLSDLREIEHMLKPEGSLIPVDAGDIILVREDLKAKPFCEYVGRLGAGSLDFHSTIFMKAAAVIDQLRRADLPAHALEGLQVTQARDIHVLPETLLVAALTADDTTPDPQAALARLIVEALTGARYSILNTEIRSLTLDANAIIHELIRGEREPFDSCMEMVSDILRANQVDLRLYLTREQMEWLESEGYSEQKQYRLVEQIRGFNLRHDRNPMPVDDSTLRMVVEDEYEAARARTTRAFAELAGQVLFVVLVIASFYGLRALVSEPAEVHTIGEQLSYRIVVRNSQFTGSFPDRTQKVVRRTGRGYFYIQWLSDAPDKNYKMVFTNNGAHYYETPEASIRNERYWYMYTHMRHSGVGDLVLNVVVDGETVATHPIPISDTSLGAWWNYVLLLAFWGLVYLLLQAFVFRARFLKG